MINHIAVSIICLTYNQKEYIRDAIEGFLNQKTFFAYEIIIHDDASTDGTTEILKEYKNQYPDKIKLFTEKENQYSKGTRIVKDILYPAAEGKYIAFCEGDDYWIYDGKLQEQYQLMENHPEIALCYHNALIIEEEKDRLTINVEGHPSGYIQDRDIICTSKGWYPSNSVFYRAEYLEDKPYFKAPTGDEELRNYMACRGRVYFINRAWSVYRQFANGSWNSKYETDKEVAQKYVKNMVDYFIRFNEYSNKRFEEYIYERMRRSLMYYIEVHCAKLYTMDEFQIYIEELKILTEHKADAFLDRLYSIEAICCTDYYPVTIEQKVQNLMKKDTLLYIYGAGTEALKALLSLQKYDMDIKGFIVSQKTSGNELLGYPIFEMGEVKREGNVVIWPCFVKERETVIRMLSENNLCKVIL